MDEASATRLGRRTVPSLLSSDLQETIRFYTKVLGFELTGCYPDPEDPGWIELAEELRGRLSFEWGPGVMDYGMREFAVRDPDGYLLAFTELA